MIRKRIATGKGWAFRTDGGVRMDARVRRIGEKDHRE